MWFEALLLINLAIKVGSRTPKSKVIVINKALEHAITRLSGRPQGHEPHRSGPIRPTYVQRLDYALEADARSDSEYEKSFS